VSGDSDEDAWTIVELGSIMDVDGLTTNWVLLMVLADDVLASGWLGPEVLPEVLPEGCIVCVDCWDNVFKVLACTGSVVGAIN
jgi:hypothetical protein